MAQTIECNATALCYNHPNYFSHGKTIKVAKTLKPFNAVLQEKYPEATVTELYIAGQEKDPYESVGNAYWSATVQVQGTVDEARAKEIGEEIAGMLWGQYGLGDSDELDVEISTTQEA